MEGSGRWARYRAPETVSLEAWATSGIPAASARLETRPPLSEASADIWNYVRRPIGERKPVGYDRSFLESYRPNETRYLSEEERVRLRNLGGAQIAGQPAGTHAKQILNRLLIDLSWNSSRLEGNTYSLLDTARLIEAGEEGVQL